MENGHCPFLARHFQGKPACTGIFGVYIEVIGGYHEPKGLGIVFAMKTGMENSINKASVSFLALATLVIAAIAAKIRATAITQAPEGYEDATGFHFGHPNIEE